MHHDQLDLDEWVSRLPLESFSPDKLCGRVVVGPSRLAIIEQLRRQLNLEPDAASLSCDLFVLSLGSAPKQFITKFGGVPYRPKDKPWPTSQGSPLQFIAQFCFLDSKDLVPVVPGDVLLIFADRSWDPCNKPNKYFICEWTRYAIPDEELLPQIDAEYTQSLECFGSRVRVRDYQNVAEIAAAAKKKASPFLMRRHEKSTEYIGLSRYLGMKIGGLPFPKDSQATPRGTLIASLSTIIPEKDIVYPFYNREEAIPMRSRISREETSRRAAAPQEQDWYLYDGMTICFFWDLESQRLEVVSYLH